MRRGIGKSSETPPTVPSATLHELVRQPVLRDGRTPARCARSAIPFLPRWARTSRVRREGDAYHEVLLGGAAGRFGRSRRAERRSGSTHRGPAAGRRAGQRQSLSQLELRKAAEREGKRE